MKFLDTLAAKYTALGLNQPQWVSEQAPGVIPTVASAAGNIASTVASTVAPGAVAAGPG